MVQVDAAPRVDAQQAALDAVTKTVPTSIVDRLLDYGYRRLGLWLPVVVLAALQGPALVLNTIAAMTFARVEQLPGHLTGKLALSTGVVELTIGVVGVYAVRHVTRPLAAWLGGDRDPAGAADAWLLARRVPILAARWWAVLGLIAVPSVLLSIRMVTPLDAGAIAEVVLAVLAAFILGIILAAFGVQLMLRPVIHDIAQSLDRFPPTGHVRSVRLKLLVGVPLISVSAGVGAIVTAAPAGTPWSEVLQQTLFVIALGLVYVLPAVFLLVYSAIRPIDDLLMATEQLKRGDFQTRVPELSGDEYGVLARSFNEAMVGLAERQWLASENERLLDEVRASRTRIVTASDAERRRIERNIHDGAQQELVSIAVRLRMLEERTTDAEGRKAIGEISVRLKSALDELRELARGLHPSVLTSDGLAPALEQLASRAPLPVQVSAPADRFPQAVESTGYFVASEALANVAKHAHASRAWVSVERRGDRLVIEIGDDGAGGARTADGSGLTGLHDRVAALDGQLTVTSPTGDGTVLTAEFPVQ